MQEISHDPLACRIYFESSCLACQEGWIESLLNGKYKTVAEQQKEWDRISLQPLLEFYDRTKKQDLKKSLKNRIEMMVEVLDG